MTKRGSGGRCLAAAITTSALLSASVAWADPPAPAPAPASAPTPAQVKQLQEGQHFTIDPVADGVLIAGSAGFAGLLSLVLSTGEIKATPPGPQSNLLSFDQTAVTQTIDPNANTYADIVLYSSLGFAVLDPILSGFRDGWDAALVDVVMYAETLSITEMLTDITKIAVRRPRPIDYVSCPSTGPQTNCSDTNNQLSFFSGHASTVASIGATATYLAFQRSPHSPRPWVTLGVSVLLTGFVSYERVRGGDHFPTDVIAGSMAGAAVGVLVPHLHRHQEEAPPVWIGAGPTPGGGGTVTLGGRF